MKTNQPIFMKTIMLLNCQEYFGSVKIIISKIMEIEMTIYFLGFVRSGYMTSYPF